MPNTISEICTLCNLNQAGNLTHSLLCPYNNGVGLFLVEKLSQYIPNLLPEQVVLLDLAVDKEHQLPFTFLNAIEVSLLPASSTPDPYQTHTSSLPESSMQFRF